MPLPMTWLMDKFGIGPYETLMSIAGKACLARWLETVRTEITYKDEPEVL